MEIKYQKRMSKEKLIDGEENEGISLDLIEAIEQKIGKKFPQSYREFLYLGGENANMLLDMECSVTDDYWQEIRENALDLLKEDKIEIDDNFWVVAMGDDEFFFFYFDGKEDPEIFKFSSFGYPDAGITKENETLTAFIDWCIEYRKREGY